MKIKSDNILVPFGFKFSKYQTTWWFPMKDTCADVDYCFTKQAYQIVYQTIKTINLFSLLHFHQAYHQSLYICESLVSLPKFKL